MLDGGWAGVPTMASLECWVLEQEGQAQLAPFLHAATWPGSRAGRWPSHRVAPGSMSPALKLVGPSRAGLGRHSVPSTGIRGPTRSKMSPDSKRAVTLLPCWGTPVHRAETSEGRDMKTQGHRSLCNATSSPQPWLRRGRTSDGGWTSRPGMRPCLLAPPPS